MFPPNRLWMPAPMLPTIERERTMMPRTTPSDLLTRKPGNSNAVVVKGCVLLMLSPAIQHQSWPQPKPIFSVPGFFGGLPVKDAPAEPACAPAENRRNPDDESLKQDQ